MLETISENFEIKEIKEYLDSITIIFEERQNLIPEKLKRKKVVLDGFLKPLELQALSWEDKKIYIALYKRRWKEKSEHGQRYSNTYNLCTGIKIPYTFGNFLKENIKKMQPDKFNKLWNKTKKIPLYLGLLALPFLGNAQEKPLSTINPFWHNQGESEWSHADSVWNLADKDTKIAMLEYAFTQDSIYHYGDPSWSDSGFGYATQTMINYNGYNELIDSSLNMTNFPPFTTNHNGEFKIPVFYAMYSGDVTKSAVMVGDNIFDLNDWYIFKAHELPGSSDRRLTPGHGLPTTYPYLNFDTISYWTNDDTDTTYIYHPSPPNFLSLSYNSDTTLVNSHNIYSLVLKNPKYDSIPPEITCSIQDSSIVNISDFDISVSDCESDSSFLNEYQFYKIDEQELDTFPGTWDPSIYRVPLYKKDITIPISLNDGAHTLKIYGLDLPMNKDSLVVNFTQDATPPQLNVNSPKDSTYHINKIPLDFTASDENLDSANSYIEFNSDSKIYLNQQIPDSLTSKQGANNLKFYIYDLAQNLKQKTINYTSDTINSIAENKISDFKLYPNPTNSNFTIEYFLQSPENVSFKMYNSQGQELEDKLIKSNVGENKFNVDMSSYSPGIYFYKFTANKIYKSGKIILINSIKH